MTKLEIFFRSGNEFYFGLILPFYQKYWKELPITNAQRNTMVSVVNK